MRRLIPLLAAALVLTPAPARGATVARVTIGRAAASDLSTLEGLGLDVTENVKPGSVDVVLHTRADARRLRAAGFAFRRLPAVRPTAVAAARSALPSGRTSYRHYGDYLHDLAALAAGHPGLVRQITLPERSVLGEPLVGVELGRDVNRTDDGRPVYLVLGEHHAREWASGEVPMEFAIDLARGYGTDPRITSLLDRERVVVVPVVNPDGFRISRDNVRPAARYAAIAHGGTMRRKNCAADGPSEAALPCQDRAGVDLNRNYGAGWGGNGASPLFADDDYRGRAPWSEPETRAIHELAGSLPLTGLETLHNYAGLVLRPPGTRVMGRAPDNVKLRRLGDAMGRATGYTSEHGYQLYEVTGAAEDWNYAAQGVFGYTIELGGNGFQDTYRRGVVEQYLGRAGTGSAGLGARDALLLAGEEAADPADHAIVRGSAPPGRILRLHKDFATATSPVCPTSVATAPFACPVLLQPVLLDDHLDTTLTVPADGRFVWNVGPSTRPFERRAGRTEAWTLTCETPDGQVLERRPVVVWRGQTATVDLGCGAGAPSSDPVVTATPPDPAGAPYEARLRALTAPPPRGTRLRAVARARGGAVRVTLRASGTTLRNLSVLLSDRLRDVVATRHVDRLAHRRVTVELRSPGGLTGGRYRGTARGYAPHRAPPSARAGGAVDNAAHVSS